MIVKEMKGWVLSIFLIGLLNSSFGQGFKMHYSNSFADCFGAVEVLDYNNESQIQFPGNFGYRDDFVNMFPDFHEVNSVWLRLEPNLTGNLEFEIFTENNVDFSYFLFKADDNSFCEKLEADKVRPVLYAMNSYYTKGAETVPRDDNFNPSIETKPADVFYLMIHTNSTYKGKVRVKYKRLGKVTQTASVIQDFRKDKTADAPYIRLRIRDKETFEPVEANMIISGLGKDNALFMGTDFMFDAARAKDLHIESNTPGYFLFVKDVTLASKGSNADILIELERLEAGKKLLLEDIKFHQDSDDFLPIAYPALKRLLDFLAVNDDIRIDIQGHVNAPDIENNNKIQRLSEDRSKAVLKFLKNNGIDSERLQASGHGNTQMLFENPKTYEEEEANRRVEIVIIE